MRVEAGRAEELFEVIVPFSTEPNAGDLERLFKRGMNAVVSVPPSVMLGNWTPTIEEERAVIEAYAENVIRPFTNVGT